MCDVPWEDLLQFDLYYRITGLKLFSVHRYMPAVAKIFCLQDIHNVLGRLIPLLCRHQGYFPGVKWPEGEFDNSPSSSAEIKNEWGYTITPLHVFMAWTDKD